MSFSASSISPSAQRLQPLDQLSPEQCREVRLIASDMDGTLTQNETFQPELLVALQRLQRAKLPLVIVTGRSAGWVQAVAHYLPVAGAIAENGGLVYRPPHYLPELLLELPEVTDHRRRLAELFAQLQSDFPQLQESADNRFRITDWTFDLAELTAPELDQLQVRCADQGWGFTYSTVQCHIHPPLQNKGGAITQLLKQFFAELDAARFPERVLTLGDSPNDASLFNPEQFPLSVGVSNVGRYASRLPHAPQFITPSAEGAGFCELVERLLASRNSAKPQM